MITLFLIGVFETTLFPQSLFFENQFNPTLESRENLQLVAGTGTKFGLSELRTYHIYATFKTYRLKVHSFGNDLYRENMLRLGRCFGIRELWFVGFNVSVLNNWVRDNFNRYTYSLSLSSAFQKRTVKVSGWICNLNLPRLSSTDYLPISYSVRFDYLPTDKLDFVFALRGMKKDIPFFNFGILFSPHEMINIGTGANTDPLYLEYILRINVGDFNVSYSGSNHQYLGLSHAFNLEFSP